MLMHMPMEWLPEVRSSWDSFTEQFSQQLQGVREQTVIGFGRLLVREHSIGRRLSCSSSSNQSINPAQGQYISDTFVLLDLILKCVRRIPCPATDGLLLSS
jgi:hypothetical protein